MWEHCGNSQASERETLVMKNIDWLFNYFSHQLLVWGLNQHSLEFMVGKCGLSALLFYFVLLLCFYLFYLFIIFGCIGSSLLRVGFL